MAHGRITGVVVVLLVCVPVMLWGKVTTAPATRAAVATTRAGEKLFDPAALHVVHLKLSKAAWEQMQPTRKGPFSGLFAASRPVKADEPKQDNPFGYTYTYVHAAIDCDGVTWKDVGLRFKGNSSYMVGREIKKPFKVDLNRYDQTQSIDGLAGFNLHNNAMDPTLMREALSYGFFADAGVPAPRVSNALVYLSVPGEYERRLAGLYVVVEEVDKSFLRDRFGTAKGLLLKPENCFDLPYLGEDFERYRKIYRPKTEATPRTARRLIEFVKLIHDADDGTFAKRIGEYLDVDAFLRFVASNGLLANMDSFLTTGHNFYLYVHPDTLKIHFIPWDLNLSLGTFDWPGTLAEQANLSVLQPYIKANHLIERVLAVPAYERAYLAEVDRLTRTSFTPRAMGGRVEMMRSVIARAEKQANVPHKPLPARAGPELDPTVFIAKRYESVRGQLSGTREGFLPYWERGFFGVGKPPTTRPVMRFKVGATAPAGKQEKR
ncbi:MAG TPA: CotH kinase family protein [Tepidisphaeraceae bacterium]|jgi:hypothetical protein